METFELRELAHKHRSTREVGITLLLASLVLALFLSVPMGPQPIREVTVSEVPHPDVFTQVPIRAQAAMVYDLATGEILFEKNADAQLPLASLTKLLTVYTALTYLSPDTPITIDPEATRVEAPRALRAGEKFALHDLARITLTASLNDGAAALLRAVEETQNTSGRTALAGAAAALDLSQTYALNGSGLDLNQVIAGGYGSARDIAQLAGAFVEQAPEIAHATTEKTARATALSGGTLTVTNTDPIVDWVPHLLLSKTGYTPLAEGNLALVVDVGIRHPVAIVVLGSSKEARFTDGAALVNATLAHFSGVPL